MNAVPQAKGQPELKELEQFLFLEARLIDEQRWEEWNDLYTEDGEYWVPATPGQPDPGNHLSLMYETGLLRAVRLKRFRHPNAFSLNPKPRSVHLVSNVMLDEYDEASSMCVVNSRFIMLQYQRDVQTVFGGSYTHRLRITDNGYKIEHKRVDLVNCDGALENIHLYL